MIHDDECGAVDGMRIDRGNRSTRRRPAPVPFCPPQNPHDLTWARTRGRRGGKLAIICLSCGMAFSFILQPSSSLRGTAPYHKRSFGNRVTAVWCGESVAASFQKTGSSSGCWLSLYFQDVLYCSSNGDGWNRTRTFNRPTIAVHYPLDHTCEVPRFH
jgi:hypothetical protein